LNFNVTKLLRSAAQAGNWVLDWGGEKRGGEQVSENERRIINQIIRIICLESHWFSMRFQILSILD
tara:strand:- start:289 stop:486 length:198 start_codon:yes stop_codon:yes gene_type:complete